MRKKGEMFLYISLCTTLPYRITVTLSITVIIGIHTQSVYIPQSIYLNNTKLNVSGNCGITYSHILLDFVFFKLTEIYF